MRYCRLHTLEVDARLAAAVLQAGSLPCWLCPPPAALAAGLIWVHLPGWSLPEVQMQAMATTIRRAARLLWALHLSFQEGFDEVPRPHAAGAVALSCCALLGMALCVRAWPRAVKPGPAAELTSQECTAARALLTLAARAS